MRPITRCGYGKTSGEFRLHGPYNGPIGTGSIRIDEASAYGEPFEQASATLRFEGTGVRLDGVNIGKGGGSIKGAAWVGWDRRYSFNADGERIPIESVVFLQYPQAPLSGVASFNVNGASSFDRPRYDLKGRIADLFLKDEGIGQVHRAPGHRRRSDERRHRGGVAAPVAHSLGPDGADALGRLRHPVPFHRHVDRSLRPGACPRDLAFTRAVATAR